MTALAGFWHPGAAGRAGPACDRMLTAQAQYGPHDHTQWSDGPIALGRRLYRLVPEDRFDQGPVHSADGRFTLVADVRLDNRDELITTLALDPAAGACLSDAALILAAFERWDEQCLDYLVGDFAFALCDHARHRLLLARDFLGQRPLHYHHTPAFFAFASMPSGLLALDEVAATVNEERLDEFLLALPELGPATFFEGICMVESGHVVTLDLRGAADRLRVRRYWNPRPRALDLGGADHYAAALRELLDTATRARLRGAGNHVAAHLSAGLDSSAVTATAARLLPPGAVLTAFTSVPAETPPAAPPGRIVDEGPLAARTAALYPTIEHVLVRGAERSVLDLLEPILASVQRPVANLCNYTWLSLINEAARERGITVMLTGQMGNWGLTLDGRSILPALLRQRRLGRWWSEARGQMATRRLRWTGVVLESLGHALPRPLWRALLHLRQRSGSPDPHLHSALHPDRLARVDLPARLAALGVDPLAPLPADDIGFRLRLLQSMDCGMINKGALALWGIDMRDPTADRRLIEFGLSVPIEFCCVHGRTRALARRALADRLPQAVLEETRRGLQGVDWHAGLTRDRQRLEQTLAQLAEQPLAARLLDLPRLNRLVATWPQTDWLRPDILQPYRVALLRALSAGHFLRQTRAPAL